MPWTFGGAASGGKARKKTARKKSQTRKPSRGIGRRLLNAGLADIMREEREDEERRKNQTATAAAAAAVGAAAKPAGAATKPKARAPQMSVRLSNAKKVAAAPSMSSKPAARSMPVDQTVARRNSFVAFLNETSTPVTSAWRNDNGVGTNDMHYGLSGSVLVFSFKTEQEQLDSDDKTLVLGATMYRRNNRKNNYPLERQCQAVMRLRGGQITHKWTDWYSNGMFAWLVSKSLAKKVPLPHQVCVLANENDLHARDSERGLDRRTDYAHYVFAENQSFPPSSSW